MGSRVKTFYVWFTMCDAVEAEDSDEAFELALERLRTADGAEVIKHQVLDE